MSIQNYAWDKLNHAVSWSFNGKTIKKSFENMHFAYLNTQENFVLIKAGKNFIAEQVYYLSFEGQQLFAFDKINGKVSWQLQNQFVEVNCRNIVTANIYIEQGVVLVITGKNQTDSILRGYTVDGAELFVKQPPHGYTFNYLTALRSKPAVVCDGGTANADAFGRSSWHFAIDTKTGDMTKENLSY